MAKKRTIWKKKTSLKKSAKGKKKVDEVQQSGIARKEMLKTPSIFYPTANSAFAPTPAYPPDNYPSINIFNV